MTRLDAFWVAWLATGLAVEAWATRYDHWHTLSGLVWRATEGPGARVVLALGLGLVAVHWLAPEPFGWRVPKGEPIPTGTAPAFVEAVATEAMAMRLGTIEAQQAEWDKWQATADAEYGDG